MLRAAMDYNATHAVPQSKGSRDILRILIYILDSVIVCC